MEATNAKQVLTAIAWMLKNVGWCQGTSFRNKEGIPMQHKSYLSVGNPPTCMCLFGAYQLVEAPGPVKTLAWNALVKVSSDPVVFNDQKGRTLKDILKIISQAKAVLSRG